MVKSKINKKKIQKSKLWIPQNENKTSNNIESNSWFDIKECYKKQEIDNKIENNSEISFMKCKKIKLYPTQKQRNILLTWLELYRISYNYTITELKTNPIFNFIKIRPIIRQKLQENQYLNGLIENSKIPKHTLYQAMSDVIKAYKTSFANLKRGNIKYFRMRYKKKSHHKKGLVIESTCFTKKKGKNGFCYKVLGEMKSLKPLKNIKHHCRLCYNSRTCEFWLYVPVNETKITRTKKLKYCSLDPGLRTFQTIYSPNGICYEIGNDNKKIKLLLKKIHNVKIIEGKNNKKFINKKREKISNMIDDLHWKTVKFLCRNFNNIYIGKMSTIGIVKKQGNLPKCCKEYCYCLSHFTFRERLKYKAKEYGSIIREVDESYTSKTCGKCSEIKENLCGNKIFECEKCNLTIDRDINGARNILIKNYR
jgi:IS605 OrfB family transposase